MLTKEQKEAIKRRRTKEAIATSVRKKNSERAIKNNRQRKEIRNNLKQKTIAFREQNVPIALVVVLLGISLIVLKSLITFTSPSIISGDISNEGGLIGPIEANSSELQSLSLQYNLPRTNNKWCSVTALILDENKNFICGASKDLFYERDLDGTYSEFHMRYDIDITDSGKYYYQIITKHSRADHLPQKIHFDLSHQFLGTNFLYSYGIIFLIAGALYIFYIFFDDEVTRTIPDLTNAKSKDIMLKWAKKLAPLVLIFILLGLFDVGYADSENAPASYFMNDDTHYFGK